MSDQAKIEALEREVRNLAESLDNIRIALGQDATYHLVMANDVGDVVKALEYIAETSDQAWEMREKAQRTLKKLRLLNKVSS